MKRTGEPTSGFISIFKQVTPSSNPTPKSSSNPPEIKREREDEINSLDQQDVLGSLQEEHSAPIQRSDTQGYFLRSERPGSSQNYGSYKQQVSSDEQYKGRNYESNQGRKRDYRFISPQLKEKLFAYLSTGKFTIKEAAKKLGINYSTAKYLFKKHRNQISDDQRLLHGYWFSKNPDPPSDFTTLISKLEKLEIMAATLHQKDNVDGGLEDLLREIRRMLDLFLLDNKKLPVTLHQPLIEQILAMQRMLDQYFIFISSPVRGQQPEIPDLDSKLQYFTAVPLILNSIVIQHLTLDVADEMNKNEKNVKN